MAHTFVRGKLPYWRAYFGACLTLDLHLAVLQRHWLNEYNARVRREVGEVLKSKPQMTAFYWMMNHTLYVPEHCCPRVASSATDSATHLATVIAATLVLVALAR